MAHGSRPRTTSPPSAAHSAGPPPGRDPRPRATEIQLLGAHSSGPASSPAKREPERPPSHLRAQLFQLRIELFLCDFKIKHILKERRRFEIWPSGIIPDQTAGGPGGPGGGKAGSPRSRVQIRGSPGASCTPPPPREMRSPFQCRLPHR